MAWGCVVMGCAKIRGGALAIREHAIRQARDPDIPISRRSSAPGRRCASAGLGGGGLKRIKKDKPATGVAGLSGVVVVGLSDPRRPRKGVGI